MSEPTSRIASSIDLCNRRKEWNRDVGAKLRNFDAIALELISTYLSLDHENPTKCLQPPFKAYTRAAIYYMHTHVPTYFSEAINNDDPDQSLASRTRACKF